MNFPRRGIPEKQIAAGVFDLTRPVDFLTQAQDAIGKQLRRLFRLFFRPLFRLPQNSSHFGEISVKKNEDAGRKGAQIRSGRRLPPAAVGNRGSGWIGTGFAYIFYR